MVPFSSLIFFPMSSGPFERPATLKPSVLPEDAYSIRKSLALPEVVDCLIRASGGIAEGLL